MKKIRPIPVGIVLLLLISAVCLFSALRNNTQAAAASSFGVLFEGEYSIDGGDWQPIPSDGLISATDGDVTLRGQFYLTVPDANEVIGVVQPGTLLSFYLNHIGAEIFVNGESDHLFDAENPLYGVSACGRHRCTWECDSTESDTITVVLRNPHRFGNKRAVKEFLDSLCLYSESMPDQLLRQGRVQRLIGFGILVVSLIAMGCAIFSYALRIPQKDLIALGSLILFFAGGFFIFHSPNIMLQSESVAWNTHALQLCIMLYVFFIMCLIASRLTGKRKTAGQIICALCGASDSVLLLAATTGLCRLYDTSPIWAIVHSCAVPALLVCCILSCSHASGRKKAGLILCMVPLLALGADLIGTAAGLWPNGLISQTVFLLYFAVALFASLIFIPANIRAAEREKALREELETSRISVMRSQIQPHFLYNSLSAIRELCRSDPEQAREALGDFAVYLRGNMDSLDSPEKIPFSRELTHIETYLKLEKLRFGDRLNVVYDIEETDFYLPPLTIQPLVENAVKHGICESGRSGTLTLSTKRVGDSVVVTVSDDGCGFTEEDKRNTPDKRSHIGIRNVRKRLTQMASGNLNIRSIPGKGTQATVTLPAGRGDSK